FDTAEIGEVVLEYIVVARAEEAHAELIVLKQKAAKIGRKGLDADPDAVEVIAFRHVAQMLLRERVLNADEAVGARRAITRIDVQNTDFIDRGVVVVEHRSKTKLPVRGAKRCIALVEHEI